MKGNLLQILRFCNKLPPNFAKFPNVLLPLKGASHGSQGEIMRKDGQISANSHICYIYLIKTVDSRNKWCYHESVLSGRVPGQPGSEPVSGNHRKVGQISGSIPHLTCKHKFLKGIKENEKDFCNRSGSGHGSVHGFRLCFSVQCRPL